MSNDPKLAVIHRAVAKLIPLEDDLSAKLGQAQRRSIGQPAVLAVIQPFPSMVAQHRDELARYLRDTGGTESADVRARDRSTGGKSDELPEILLNLCLAFQHCALSYGMLYEKALRLSDLRLRAIAYEHLNAQAGAALSTVRLLPAVVAGQLGQDGFDCACSCPMCGVGACGCVDWGTEALIEAVRGAAPGAATPAGFVLLPPRLGSELALAGVQGGDLVLAVDGQHVHGRQDVQDALRKHTLGDAVHFTTQRGSELPREFIVRHAGDYPRT